MTHSDQPSLGKKMFNAGIFGSIGGCIVAFNKTFNHSVFVDNPKAFIQTTKTIYGKAVGSGIIACIAYTATKHSLEQARGKEDYLNNTAGSIVTAFCLGAFTNSLKIGIRSGLLLIPLTIGAQMIHEEMNSSQELIDSRYDTKGKSKLVIHNKMEELKSQN
ncbi:hypothetical protein RB653_007226 [Dictyostelium firmibasis]|uniref:Complex I-B14.7 n=1 Tax=Dictyostelium firmibasis TaxID=79012 RepID=A0AAN7TV23_9MYCE